MANIVLTKSSGEEEIRSYFNAILELSKADNEFPVTLDEVWMLVYPRKDHAVRELRNSFHQDVDYKVFLKAGENLKGGRPAEEYHLTIPCLEFFIARKVRRVFEVYRQVFHAVAKAVFKVPKTYSEALRLAADQQEQLEAQQQKVQMLESENAVISEERDRLLPKAQYTDEVLQSGSTYTFTQVAHDLGLRSVHALLSELFRRKVLFRQSGQIQPTAKVAEKGYFKTRTAKFFRSDGSVGTTLSTVVTESGRAYLHSLLNEKGGAPCLR